MVDALGVWGSRWLELAPEHFDASVVLWSMCRHAEPGDVPGRRLVIRFDLADGRRRHFWVVLAPPESEVCVKPPGFDEDLVVATSSEWLAKWHMGRISLGAAMHDGLMSVRGPSELVHALSSLGISKFAAVEAATLGQRVVDPLAVAAPERELLGPAAEDGLVLVGAGAVADLDEQEVRRVAAAFGGVDAARRRPRASRGPSRGPAPRPRRGRG